jgi:hypothetical protein
MYQFPDHATYVAACEQFAEDLISFIADSIELTIETADELPPKLKKWVKQVCVNDPFGE